MAIKHALCRMIMVVRYRSYSYTAIYTSVAVDKCDKAYNMDKQLRALMSSVQQWREMIPI